MSKHEQPDLPELFDEDKLREEVQSFVAMRASQYEEFYKRNPENTFAFRAMSQLLEGSEFDNFCRYADNFHSYLPGHYKEESLHSRSIEPDESQRIQKTMNDVRKVIELLQLAEENLRKMPTTTQPLGEDERARELFRQLYIEMRRRGYTHAELST